MSLNDLSGWDFSGQDLSGAILSRAELANTNLTGAIVAGTSFDSARGLSSEQLYSTASYQARNLEGIGLASQDLTGWDFRGQNLSSADLDGAKLTGADLTGADLRHAIASGGIFEGAIADNLISIDGEIQGLSIRDGERLLIRDVDYAHGWPIYTPITVLHTANFAPGGSLQLLFQIDNEWGSLISFESGIPVQLDGALELTFADSVNVATQVGRTLRIFDWTGVSPSGRFEISSPYIWDTSNIYTTGEVTLVAVPEPRTAWFLLVPITTFAAACRVSVPRRSAPCPNRQRS
jgi:uncharacterized protein YjbI with pentapeptide repeats